MNEKISLAGDLGSGKSTVSAILKERLGAQTYSTGALVRDIATRRGMTVGELNTYMETHPEIDHEIDDGLKALSRDPRRLIIDSRMAWHFTEGTFKIYLSTDLKTSASRILGAGRTEEQAASLSDMMASIYARRKSEEKRYLEQYGVNIKDLTNYDLVVDTTYATPEAIAEVIIDAFTQWQADRSYSAALVHPSRLMLPKEADSSACDTVTAHECDGRFYVLCGADTVYKQAACADFIRLHLVNDICHYDEYIPYTGDHHADT